VNPPWVRVQWEDINADHDQHDARWMLDRRALVTTYGLLLHEDKDYIVLASESIDESGDVTYRCQTRIMRSVIDSIQELSATTPERTPRTRSSTSRAGATAFRRRPTRAKSRS
jgi:hypothetical protein